MPKDQLAELTQPQRDRLAFIELRAREPAIPIGARTSG